MGELADQWASEGDPNLWGTVPHVIEMQSEGGRPARSMARCRTGADDDLHGQQGLLLMIPNMYKIAGELTPAVLHVAARVACDAGAVDLRRPQRRDGGPHDRLGLLCSNSVQEAQDLALIAHAATLEARSRSCTSSTGSARLTRSARSSC
jgi:pyruvate-ferredoxin/flavodoxin oxidoreductase